MRTAVTLAVAVALLAPTAASADVDRPVCFRTDSGSWSLVPYDDAANLGGSLTGAVLPYNGSCDALQDARLVVDRGTVTPPPTPHVRTVVRTVVRTKVVRVRVVIRNGKRTVTRRVTWR